MSVDFASVRPVFLQLLRDVTNPCLDGVRIRWCTVLCGTWRSPSIGHLWPPSVMRRSGPWRDPASIAQICGI